MNMRMEIVSLRALLKTSRDTIAMLQDQLKEKDELLERIDQQQPEQQPYQFARPQSTGLVLGNDWKISGTSLPSKLTNAVSVPEVTS